MAKCIPLRSDVSAAELRERAAAEPNCRPRRRMLAIAEVLDGRSREDAARYVGIERQALRHAILRFNVEGIEGLFDRAKSGRRRILTPDELARLWELMDQLHRSQVGVRIDLDALSRFIRKQFGKTLSKPSLSSLRRAFELAADIGPRDGR